MGTAALVMGVLAALVMVVLAALVVLDLVMCRTATHLAAPTNYTLRVRCAWCPRP